MSGSELERSQKNQPKNLAGYEIMWSARRFVVLVVLALFAPVHSRAAENLTQLIADVRMLTLDGASASRQHFSDANITTFLNQGQAEVLAGNYCTRKSIIFKLVPGTTYYPMPTDYTVIERVLIGSKKIPQMTPASLDSQSLSWETASGYPNRWFINFSSRGLIGFAPFPQNSTDTDTIKIDYNVSAKDLSAPTDTPFNGINELQEYQHVIAYWAASTIEQINQQPGRAAYYLTLFQAVGGQMAKKCNDLKAYMPNAQAMP